MVESAPMFIEYCAQGYINCDAFNAIVAIFVIAVVGTWFGVYILVRRAFLQIFPERTK